MLLLCCDAKDIFYVSTLLALQKTNSCDQGVYGTHSSKILKPAVRIVASIKVVLFCEP